MTTPQLGQAQLGTDAGFSGDSKALRADANGEVASQSDETGDRAREGSAGGSGGPFPNTGRFLLSGIRYG